MCFVLHSNICFAPIQPILSINICVRSESSHLPLPVSQSPTGDEEEDTSGYISDTANNTCSSPELVVERRPTRMSRPAIRLPDGHPEPIDDFTEFQYAKYARDRPHRATCVDANSNECPDRVKQYYHPSGQPGIGRNGNLVIPPGYHHPVARSVKSRSTFAGDDTDLGHETDFSIPK